MQGIQLQTSQNVTIDQEIAGIGDRIVATFIDYVIFLAYLSLMSYFASEMGWNFLFSGFGPLLLMLPIFLYDLFCEVFLEGRNIGKLVMNTRVVRLDGSPPALSHYLIRWALRIVDFLPAYWAAGTVTILANGRGQRIGDLVAGTTVIKTAQRTDLNDTILSRVDADHEVQFPEVRDLRDQDIRTMLEIIQSAEKNKNPRLLRPLAKKLRSSLAVSTEMNDKDFLETLLKDYANLDYPGNGDGTVKP